MNMQINILCGIQQSNILKSLDKSFNVAYANNYEVFKQHYNNNKFHVILIDYNITNNIFDALKSIKNTHIILMTNDINNITQDIYEYINDFIIYPISSEFVRHRINMALKPSYINIISLIEWYLSEICMYITNQEIWQSIKIYIMKVACILNIAQNKIDNNIYELIKNNTNIHIPENHNISYNLIFMLTLLYEKEKIENYQINVLDHGDIEYSHNIIDQYSDIINNLNMHNNKLIAIHIS